jgi:GvpD gas vesicle protein
MPSASMKAEERSWTPIVDPVGRFSSGIPDLDRLLGGGYRRGSFALFTQDASVTLDDLHLLFAPVWINFLHRSRGMIAVLPAQESPSSFRSALLPYVSRRLFDSRVRVVDYVGEGGEAPYIATLRGVMGSGSKGEKSRRKAMEQMALAEKAAQGARGRPFIEFNALEIIETIAGAEVAARMYLHGIKRTRMVGNLGLAVARPGLKVLDAVRSMVDYEILLRHPEVGLVISGLRPRFPEHVVILDQSRGRPHVALIPSPPGR